jgi:hypothetical protein
MVTRLLAAAALLLAGCDQFTRVEGTPLTPLSRPIVLSHRGGGDDCGAGSTVPCWPNTLPAFVHGAGLYDGPEMDLQLSRDGTIWLAHDNALWDCAEVAGLPRSQFGGDRCIQTSSDLEIESLAYCDISTGTPCTPGSSPECIQHYVTLDATLERFSTDPSLRQKFLALDVKDQLCGSTGLPESRDMADALHPLVVGYHMDWRLFVESDQRTFMDEFHANGTPTYLFVEGYGPADPIIADAAQVGATGISYRYYNEAYDPTFTEGLRKVGLRVMTWAVPDPVDHVDDIAPVYAMNPDIIATDRNDFYLYVTVPEPF